MREHPEAFPLSHKLGLAALGLGYLGLCLAGCIAAIVFIPKWFLL